MADEVTVYGIWMPGNHNPYLGDWFILSEGEIFHTTHRGLAEAQMQYVRLACDNTEQYPVIEVREFPSPTD